MQDMRRELITWEDVDKLIASLYRVKKIFRI